MFTGNLNIGEIICSSNCYGKSIHCSNTNVDMIPRKETVKNVIKKILRTNNKIK
jgi:hypothetical protein